MGNNKNKKIYKIVGTVLVLVCALSIVWFLSNKKKPEPITEFEPIVYQEVFEDPIDPNAEPERHKEVYDKIGSMVSFPLIKPLKLPAGYKLFSINSSSNFISQDSGIVYDGEFTAKYVSGEKEFKIIEGTGEPGNIGEGEKIINEDNIFYFWSYGGEDSITNLLKFGGNYENPYFLSSKTLTKEELIIIASEILRNDIE